MSFKKKKENKLDERILPLKFETTQLCYFLGAAQLMEIYQIAHISIQVEPTLVLETEEIKRYIFKRFERTDLLKSAKKKKKKNPYCIIYQHRSG